MRKNCRRLKLNFISHVVVSSTLFVCLIQPGMAKPETQLANKANKMLPQYIKLKKKRLGFLLNHYQLIKELDQESIRTITLIYGREHMPSLARVTIVNAQNQKLIYRVSTDPKYHWNRAWGYHADIFYKLYEYYPKTKNLSKLPSQSRRLLRRVSYFDANGDPGMFEKPPLDVYSKKYRIVNKKALLKMLYKIAVEPNKYSNVDDSKKQYVMEIKYNRKRKVINKIYISSFMYWLVLEESKK